MLSKKICKICWDLGWHKSDDEVWERGFVDCCHDVGSRSVYELPPIKCPYQLEHIVQDNDFGID